MEQVDTLPASLCFVQRAGNQWYGDMVKVFAILGNTMARCGCAATVVTEGICHLENYHKVVQNAGQKTYRLTIMPT